MKIKSTIITLILAGIWVIIWSSRVDAGRTNTSTLEDVAAALGAAAESLSKIVDSVDHLVKTGAKGYDAASARATYSRLKDISARASGLATSQQITVINSIDRYLDKPDPSLWIEIKQKLGVLLLDIDALLSDIRKERSDFVLETTYFDLIRTLQSRSAMLTVLIELPAPETKEELKALKAVRDKYQLLINSLREATKSLNAYLKTLKSSPEMN